MSWCSKCQPSIFFLQMVAQRAAFEYDLLWDRAKLILKTISHTSSAVAFLITSRYTAFTTFLLPKQVGGYVTLSESFFFITSAKEAMFLVWFICLIVGTIMKRNTEPFIMLLGGRVHHGPRRNPRHLNMNQNECTDNHFYIVKLRERAFSLGRVLHHVFPSSFHPTCFPSCFPLFLVHWYYLLCDDQLPKRHGILTILRSKTVADKKAVAYKQFQTNKQGRHTSSKCIQKSTVNKKSMVFEL